MVSVKTSDPTLTWKGRVGERSEPGWGEHDYCELRGNARHPHQTAFGG